MSRQAQCPGCGAPILFKIGTSALTVCEHCKALVARTDQAVEEIGKSAELFDTASRLKVGLSGKYHGIGFELTGRAQIRHAAGGVWDEWYAAFGDGQWGWMAEAQGRFYMTFPRSLESRVPSFDQLTVGDKVLHLKGDATLLVAEKGTAEYAGVQGELPFRIEPGRRYQYADLTGPEKRFATLNYSSNPPLLYYGNQVSFDDLCFKASDFAPPADAAPAKSAAINCPQCAAALDLVAPDQAQRVVCKHCNAVLDADHGNLRYLETLNPYKKPDIPLGATGVLRGQAYTVLGFMVRSTLVEGETWFWDEYLLYHPQVGFRWLVYSDDNWSFVTPLSPGDIGNESREQIKYDRTTFHRDQSSIGRVVYVLGEFYWKVSVGDEVQMDSFVNDSQSISKESSNFDGGSEVNWSFGDEISYAQIRRAFSGQIPGSAPGATGTSVLGMIGKVIFGGCFILFMGFVGLVILGAFVGGSSNSYQPQAAAIAAPQINTSEISAVEGEKVEYDIQAFNTPTHYSADALPEGLTIDPQTGRLSGIARTAGEFPIILHVQNSGGTTSRSVNLQIVNPVPELKLSEAEGTVDALFNHKLTASGASGIVFSADALPPGLALDGDTLSGTPTTAGDSEVRITAKNKAGEDSKTLRVSIAPKPPPRIQATQYVGTVDANFGQEVQASGGGPITFTSSGALPPGLTMNGRNINGRPTRSGRWELKITATNNVGEDTQTIAIVIAPKPPPTFKSATTASGRVANSFNHTINYQGGEPVSIVVGTLPSGLSFSGRTIQGTPQSAGTFNVPITLLNSVAEVSQSFTITIAPKPPPPPVIVHYSSGSSSSYRSSSGSSSSFGGGK